MTLQATRQCSLYHETRVTPHGKAICLMNCPCGSLFSGSPCGPRRLAIPGAASGEHQSIKHSFARDKAFSSTMIRYGLHTVPVQSRLQHAAAMFLQMRVDMANSCQNVLCWPTAARPGSFRYHMEMIHNIKLSPQSILLEGSRIGSTNAWFSRGRKFEHTCSTLFPGTSYFDFFAPSASAAVNRPIISWNHSFETPLSLFDILHSLSFQICRFTSCPSLSVMWL